MEVAKGAVSTAAEVAARAAVSTEAVQVVAKAAKATPAVKAEAAEVAKLPEIAKSEGRAGRLWTRPASFRSVRPISGVAAGVRGAACVACRTRPPAGPVLWAHTSHA